MSNSDEPRDAFAVVDGARGVARADSYTGLQCSGVQAVSDLVIEYASRLLDLVAPTREPIPVRPDSDFVTNYRGDA